MRIVRLATIGVILGLSACAWLYVFNPERLRKEPSMVQVINTPNPRPTASAAPSSTPVVAGLASVKILMYGVKITVADPISDLVYGAVKFNGVDAAAFTTESLLAKYPACTAGALGILIRTPTQATPSPSKTPSHDGISYPTPTPSYQNFKKYVNGFTYSYIKSYASCATDESGRDALAADRVAIQNSALPSLSD